MNNWIKISIFSLLFFGIINVTYFVYLLSPASENSTLRYITIDLGSGFKSIGDFLKAEGLVHSARAFKFYSVLSGSAHRLKAGRYLIAANASTPMIVKLLKAGPPDVEILITEGRALRDIDAQLSGLGLITPGALLKFPANSLAADYPFINQTKKLEGFMFPDTYRIAPDFSLEAIIRKILDNFKHKAWPEVERLADNFSKTAYRLRINGSQLLAMASMVEKEVPFAEDRVLVAGILWKRLVLGMALQVDATVIYAQCQNAAPDSDRCQDLTKEDYRLKSVYNTYYYPGLPPAPIANPGLDAIRAAGNPKTSDFLYYLSDPATHKTIFSKTLEEHNRNRAKYLF